MQFLWTDARWIIPLYILKRGFNSFLMCKHCLQSTIITISKTVSSDYFASNLFIWDISHDLLDGTYFSFLSILILWSVRQTFVFLSFPSFLIEINMAKENNPTGWTADMQRKESTINIFHYEIIFWRSYTVQFVVLTTIHREDIRCILSVWNGAPILLWVEEVALLPLVADVIGVYCTII